MNELDLAKAIAAGEAPSPSRCGRTWLFDLRVSGVGIADRAAAGETAYRAPEIWTSPEMVQRAAGLALILGHPESNTLNAEEYELRSIGAIVFPFVRDGELRGIGRVFDAAVAVAMASGEFSTSPCAAYAKGENRSVAGTDGALLIEGDPTLLDHLAIVPNRGDVGGGVWDKGGEPAGIRVDSTQVGDTTMADVTEDSTDKKKPEEGDKMDKLMEAIGGLADGFKSLAGRMDALEKKPEARADYAGGEDYDGRAVKLDTAEQPQEQREREENERAAMADAQAKCDSVAMAFGERAPKPMMGERPRAYRERVLRQFQRHSAEFKDVKMSHLPAGAAFDAIEARVFADAMEAARRPTPHSPDVLIERIVPQPYGGHHVEFHGHPSAWMNRFKRVNTRGYIRSARSIASAA